MRKLTLITAFVLCSSIGAAATNLVTNSDFDDASLVPWYNNAEGFVHGIDAETGDTMVNVGWWWYDGVWQDIGKVFLRNTVYTMTVRARDGGDGNRGSTSEFNNDPADKSIAFGLADIDREWLHLDDVPFQFPETPGIFGDGTPWYEYQVTFDTVANPEVVGHGLGVVLFAVNGPILAAWTSFDFIGLTATTADNPSPANDTNLTDDIDEAGDPNGLGQHTVNVTLEWDTAVDPCGVTRTDITKHYVYIQENEPNFLGIAPLATVASNSYLATGLNAGSIYFWKIEESVNDSAYDDPCTLPGYSGGFETLTGNLCTVL